MPIYEYRCQCCGEKFEELVFGTVSDDEIVCPKCNERKSEKLISACSSTRSGKSSSSFSSGGCGSGGFT